MERGSSASHRNAAPSRARRHLDRPITDLLPALDHAKRCSSRADGVHMRVNAGLKSAEKAISTITAASSSLSSRWGFYPPRWPGPQIFAGALVRRERPVEAHP